MPDSDTIDERLRSVDQSATEAAKVPGSSESGNFADAHLNAAEMVELMKRRYESAGARIDALSATVRSGKAAFRSEVTLDAAAAEKLFGTPTSALKLSSVPPRVVVNRREEMLGSIYQSSTHMLRMSGRELNRPADRSDQMALPDWMQSVLAMDRSDQIPPALDTMFHQIDSMLSAEQFAKVDEVLATMPVEGPSLSLMMGLLSITRPAAKQLPSRGHFFARVYRLCKAMRRDAESLLGGLK